MNHLERIAEHLTGQPTPFCDTCLALDVGIILTDTRRAIARLVEMGKVKRQLALCGLCGRTLPTSVATNRIEPAEGEIAEFLERDRAVRVCHTCIGHAVGIGFEKVRKATWGLRALGRCRAAAGICDVCHCARLVLSATSRVA